MIAALVSFQVKPGEVEELSIGLLLCRLKAM
jgi:hypothetical protein